MGAIKFDQTLSWIFAVLCAGAIMGGVVFGLKTLSPDHEEAVMEAHDLVNDHSEKQHHEEKSEHKEHH